MFVQKVSAEILCGGLKHICQSKSGLHKCILSVLAADVLNHFGCHEMLKWVLNLVDCIPWFWRKALAKVHTHLIATTALWSARLMRGSCAALRLLFISNLHTCILPAACRKCVCVCQGVSNKLNLRNHKVLSCTSPWCSSQLSLPFNYYWQSRRVWPTSWNTLKLPS